MHTHKRSNKLNDICWMSQKRGQCTRRLLTTQRKPSPHTSPWKAHLHHHSLHHVHHTTRRLSKHTTASTWHSRFFYPNDPLQPGPMYFLTPRKYAIFGVCCEAIPRQVNYFIDKAVDMGKGSNAIVSMLHHYFVHHALGERRKESSPACRQLRRPK